MKTCVVFFVVVVGYGVVTGSGGGANITPVQDTGYGQDVRGYQTYGTDGENNGKSGCGADYYQREKDCDDERYGYGVHGDLPAWSDLCSDSR